MKHPEELKRLFGKTDDEVLQQSDVLFDSYVTNQGQFVARFPDLGEPFAEGWSEVTAIARALPPDYSVVAGQANETTVLETLMEEGRNLFQTVMLYTQLAFPDNTAILHLFGQQQYDSARNKQLKLPVLLRTTYAQVSKPEYKTALTAKGLKVEEIEQLESLAESIVNQNTVQQNAKKARSLAASERIAVMNEVWGKMSMVCQCAKLVFQDDAARYNLFLLTDQEIPAPENPPAPAN